ncbi:MAG: glycosyltransferase family 4 protein [Acidobacteriaceae bacterium]|jgi:glycosyltransferase involved in cell wall biosynthesis|nr:glycosyltransferase family 4 protein [Acidobacteriaceae bacterium]
MRILMIAPQPFFEPRGTPFSEYHRIRALTDLGHQVDLVTYPFGRDVTIPGLRVFRAMRPPFVRHVKIGPSLAKLPLDAALTLTAFRRAVAEKYDAVHSHEEGGLIGVVLAALLRVPHLYDMHSSLPQQLSNFAFSGSRLIRGVFNVIERVMIRRSRVVIVICPALEETVRGIDPDAQVVLIENAPGSGEEVPSADDVRAVRERFHLTPEMPVVLYTGTFEAYQGLDLLFDAMRLVHAERPDARLLMAGGRPDLVVRAKADATAAGIGDVTIFAGERPAEEIPAYLAACTALVSPRSRGTNTPLKIYQYLRSGKPIVATRLRTHTQVLDDTTSILTGATAAEFAAGILASINDPARAAAVGQAAGELARTKYSYDAYLARTRQAISGLAPDRPLKPVKDLA